MFPGVIIDNVAVVPDSSDLHEHRPSWRVTRLVASKDGSYETRSHTWFYDPDPAIWIPNFQETLEGPFSFWSGLAARRQGGPVHYDWQLLQNWAEPKFNLVSYCNLSGDPRMSVQTASAFSIAYLRAAGASLWNISKLSRTVLDTFSKDALSQTKTAFN